MTDTAIFPRHSELCMFLYNSPVTIICFLIALVLIASKHLPAHSRSKIEILEKEMRFVQSQQ